jgi:hypothetical protein
MQTRIIFFAYVTFAGPTRKMSKAKRVRVNIVNPPDFRISCSKNCCYNVIKTSDGSMT